MRGAELGDAGGRDNGVVRVATGELATEEHGPEVLGVAAQAWLLGRKAVTRRCLESGDNSSHCGLPYIERR